MALVLSIETSTPVCSVALAVDNRLLISKENRDGLSHASHLTTLIEEMFREIKEFSIKDLDAVAVSIGPGSYTGLRIGVSTAKGICYALGINLIAISSLEVMTWEIPNHPAIINNKNMWLCPMIDARRMEVYVSFFDLEMNQQSEISAEIIDDQSFINILDNHPVLFFGNGSDKCIDIIQHPNASFIPNIHPLAKNMVTPAFRAFELGRFENVAYLEPFYLKDFVAIKPKNKVL